MGLWIAAVTSAPLCACDLAEDDVARAHDSIDTIARFSGTFAGMDTDMRLVEPAGAAVRFRGAAK